MAELDVEALLREVSPEAPCGADLSYDPEYLELERLAAGTPERQVGNSVIEAEDPDWPAVATKARELLGRSKDLRVAVYLALSELKLRGVPGLRDALEVINGLLSRYWEHLYPQLDPEEGNDPLERLNVVSALSATGAYDTMQFRKHLREAPLCRSKQHGIFSLRDILIAVGQMPPSNPEEPVAEMAAINAAFEELSPEELQALCAAADRSAELIKSISGVLAEQAGAGRAPQFEEFRAIMGDICKQLQSQLARRGLGAAPSGDGQAAAAAAAPAGEPAAAGAGAVAAAPGEIRSTRDVIAALDRICEYYERHEPSSPIPLLLRRAQRLVSKSFIDIIKDLSPEAMQRIEMISGTEGQPPAST